MGIIPGVCLLVLLSVNLGDATAIAPNHLKDIIDKFHKALSKNKDLNQFAFLMALNKEQCTSGLTNFTPILTQTTPDNDLNYISFKPGKMVAIASTKPKVCSETHILFPLGQNAQSPAQEFGKLQTEKETFKDGGCVIFYTTNTPCTNRCFKELDNTKGDVPCFEIIDPLKKAPFDDWHNNPNIDMYFVYSKLYVPRINDLKSEEGYLQHQQNTLKGFRRLDENNFYHIIRCDNNGCQMCDFCLGKWPAWSELKSGSLK